jgi:CHAD domain-containing protein
VTQRLDGNTPLWIAARVLLHEKGDDFFRCTGKVLENFEPDDIHDLRVASRRLREGLSLFAPCYPPDSILPLVKKTKRVTRLLGDIRNTDEAILFFSALYDEVGEPYHDGLETLLRLFNEKRKKVIRKLRSGLPEIVPPSLHELYRRSVNAPLLFKQAPPGVDLLGALYAFARTAFEERFSEVLKLVPASRQSDGAEPQHLLRIAVKHYRYRLEILSFLVGERYGEIHAAVKGYQEVLGRMHDMDVFDGIIREADLPAPAKDHLCYIIKMRREKYFADFSAMLETLPLEKMGAGLGRNR